MIAWLGRTSHALYRACIRGVAILAVVAAYGFSHIGVVTLSGSFLTASTAPAEAGWRRRWWGRRWSRARRR